MRGSKCQSTDFVSLRGKKIVQTMPTKQNSATFWGFFSKFPMITPVTFFMRAPWPQGCPLTGSLTVFSYFSTQAENTCIQEVDVLNKAYQT